MSDGNDREARIFPVETRFQKLARRAGGISRDQAIEKAWAKVEEIKPGFDEWLDKELQDLADVIKSVQPGAPVSDWIDIANGHSRQLRDVGTTMGSELLTYVANSLCEVLDAIAAGAEYNAESVICHIDALFLARQQPYRNLKPDQVPELTSGLRRVVNLINTSPT
jgi:hypothetical protein